MAIKQAPLLDSEDIFLSDILRGYKYWKKRIAELEKDQRDVTKEKEYAEAYRLLLNQFTHIEKQQQTE